MKPWKPKARRVGAVGFKLGMMSHYDEWGRRHPVTVLRLDKCQAVRSFKLGVSTIQELGAGHKSWQQLKSGQASLYAKLKIPPKLSVSGFSVDPDAVIPSGTHIYAAHFVPGQLVDIQSISIGKGFQGAMVRWGFKGMPASHGCSVSHRHIGATGGRSDPGRTFPGKKMAGRMGGHNVTVKSLKVLKVDNTLNCIFVRGAVAGHDSTPVKIMDAKRNPIFETTPPPFPTFVPSKKDPLPRFMLAPGTLKDTLHIESAE